MQFNYVTSYVEKENTMKLIHTSDWHLGRALHNHKRYDEYEAFLNWLAQLIESEGVDVVLIAGDVFDNSTPSNYAQELRNNRDRSIK